jgi:hypothetical protein
MMKVKPHGGGRFKESEVVQAALERFGVDLVRGVASVFPHSRAVQVRDWVASFCDARCAYYVHQEPDQDLLWLTAPIPKDTGAKEVVFTLSIGTGYGSVLPQATGHFDLMLGDRRLISFRVAGEDLTWRNGDVTLHYWIKRHQYAPPNVVMKMDTHITEEAMASYGIAYLKVPKALLTPGEPAKLLLAPRNRQPSRRWFKLDVDDYAHLLNTAVLEPGLEAVCAGRTPPRVGEYHVYFGDLHAHSGYSLKGRPCGRGTLDENYGYAREPGALDFCCIADHDWQTRDQEDWRQRLEVCDAHDAPGAFATLPGFEWTSFKYGHRNVYYRASQWPIFFSVSQPEAAERTDRYTDTPADLWRQLRECGARALTAAHHPSTGIFPVDWSYRDESQEFDRLVEVYSCWGNSECLGASHPGWASDRAPGLSVQDVLCSGHRVGMIASGDGHDGNPGNAQWCHRQPHIHHLLGSGLAAVLAPELTREAIFDGLYARRCYATTGTRILLDFRVNGCLMGASITSDSNTPRTITASVRGTAEVSTVTLIRNNQEIHCWPVRAREVEIVFEDDEPLQGPAFYYLRVIQADGHMAWSSPVWVGP